MKILQVNCVWNIGSTGRILFDIHRYLLENNYESIVCYGRGTKVCQKGIYKISSELEAKIHSVCSRIFGVQFSFSPIATANIISIIQHEKPDVVHLHCLNGNFLNVYKLLDYLKKNNIKTVLTLHAEIMHTAGCEHAFECEKWKKQCNNCNRINGKISRYFRDDAKYCFNKMKKAFSGFQNLTIVGVSDWLTKRAKQSAIFADSAAEFTTVFNGLNITAFQYPTSAKTVLHNSERPLILHVTPNFNYSIKGGKYVVELAQRNPQWDFWVVGPVGTQNDWPKNMKAVGKTNSVEQLARYYAAADVTLLTSKRETFSMVCAESLCCGTPVVGFKAGGPESIASPEYSEFVVFGDIGALENSMKKILAKKNDKKTCSLLATSLYSSEKMSKNYIDIYKNCNMHK